MKHISFKISLLLCLVFTHTAASQESTTPQSLMSKPSDKLNQPAITPAPAKDLIPETQPSTSEAVKTEANPKPKVRKKHKHIKPKPHPSPEASQAPKAPTVSPQTASSKSEGWFVGIRGAYVPSVIAEIGYQFNKTFKLRMIGAGFAHYNKTLSVDGQTYNKVRFKPLKVGLLADWHLWKNGFRISGGVAYNGDRIRLNQMVTGTLLGLPASVYGNITANYKYRWAIVPYLGIGYDTGSLGNSGISLSADAGFWFQGKVRSRVTLSGTGQNSTTAIDNAKLHTANLVNKNKLLRTVPMASIGIRYMF